MARSDEQGVLKHRIARYWTGRAASFGEQRSRELASAQAEVWLAELTRHLPPAPATVLDVGCGTGFFTFLLAEAGYRVTGIDLTAAMIEQACAQVPEHERAVAAAGGSVRLEVMDAEAPHLSAGEYDAIVSRNLTWTLPHLPAVYRSWLELLRPGGVLVNIDGDYTHASARLTGTGPHAALAASQVDDYEHLRTDMAALQRPRPDWDVELLGQAGFEQVSVDTDAWRRLYPTQGEFSNPTRVFVLVARRPGLAA